MVTTYAGEGCSIEDTLILLYLFVVELIVGDQPYHHPEGKVLVNGVNETGSGMMGSSSLSSCLRTGGGERKRERDRERETENNRQTRNVR